jgi:galactoside O-acetyltransferase
MTYLNRSNLVDLGFHHLGENVLISTRASIYNPELISIGDYSRIDDFCVLAGNITIGRNVHVTVFCNIEGGRAGVTLNDFVTLAYGCHIIAQTDDYSGSTMTNSTVPAHLKNESSVPTGVGRFAILGTNSVVLPGAQIAEGVASGAGTIFTKPTEPWTVYVGSPARPIKPRQRGLLDLAEQYLQPERGEPTP